LLARAAAARQAQEAQDRVSEPDGLGTDALHPIRSLERQLDLVAPNSSRPPSAPLLPRVHTQLSPTMISVFGTLLGLATVASVVAVAIQLDPKDQSEHRSTEAAKVAPDASATAPEPQPVKRVRKRIPGPWRIQDAKNQPGTRIVRGKIGRIPFLKAVQDAGVTRNQSYRILTAMKGLRNLDKCKSSDRFAVLINRASSAVRAFEYTVSKEEVYQARENANGLLTARKLDLKVERIQFKGAIAMHTEDLGAAATAAGFEPGLTRALRKAVDGHLSVEEIQTGDVVRVIAQEVTVLGEFSRYAGIEALEYRPSGGKPVRIYYFRGPDSRGYYNVKGRAPYEGGWRKPIPGAPVTSPFDLKRKHPVLKKTMPHYGVDFGARAGTPVGASSYGTVSFVGAAGPSGNLVKIEHPGGIETGYAHLQRFAENLQVGDRVKRLQPIGYCGSTGRSTGPHLHFSAKKDGKFIDPLSLNLDGMRVLPRSERPAFAQVKAKYDKLLEAIPLPAVRPAPEPAAAAVELAAEPSTSVVAMGADYEPSASAPPAAPPQSAPPSQPAAPTSPREAAVYLTDKELLEMQSRTDDGEVEE
jgi:murein DD-endopeptidase MepM/ murein hydrolase activator NlpD